MANEVIKREVEATIVAPDPFDEEKTYPVGDALGIIKSARDRVELWRGKVAALGELGEAPMAALKELSKQIGADDVRLRGYAQRYADGVVEAVGLAEAVKQLAVQIKGPGKSVDPISVRGQLAEIKAELDAAIAEQTPQEPRHTYALKMTLTDSALKAVIRAAEKVGAEGVCWAAAQSDKAAKDICKWFSQNA